MIEHPGVTYVMPVLNEQNYVASAVASIVAQDYPGPAEILLVLGPSTDRTDDIVARLAENDRRVRTLRNPQGDVPSALNRAIRSAVHPVIVRVDAHSELPAGYTRRAVHRLRATGAANVGGVMVARGQPGLQAAVAKAYNSRWGLGGGAYHSVDARPGPAESAFLGVMRIDALREVGYFDPTLRRAQDWELNHRLRGAGHVVWLEPELRVDYWPRSSLRALWRQMYVTGVWRGEVVRRLGTQNSARYFAPPALVAATAVAALLGPITAFTAFSSATWVVVPAVLGLCAYLGLVVLVSARSAGSARDRFRFAVVLAAMHYAWGTGFLNGVLRGARGAVDRSRVPQACPGSSWRNSASASETSAPDGSNNRAEPQRFRPSTRSREASQRSSTSSGVTRR
jgi:succinoglycan biosynthesis protein ExoA